MRHRARTDLYRGRREIAVPTVTYEIRSCWPTPRVSAARALKQRSSDGPCETEAHRGDRVGYVSLHRTQTRAGGRFRVRQVL